jgi:hypothetical protein
MTGGSLDYYSTRIGFLSTGLFTLNDGSVNATDATYIGGDAARAGDGFLQINGGTLSTLNLFIGLGNAGNNYGTVEINGGMLEILGDDPTKNNYLQFGLLGKMEINGTGTLKWMGDRVGVIDYMASDDFDNRIYTSEAGKWIEAVYYEDGDYTLATVVPEPSTMVILGLGGLFVTHRRKK